MTTSTRGTPTRGWGEGRGRHPRPALAYTNLRRRKAESQLRYVAVAVLHRHPTRPTTRPRGERPPPRRSTRGGKRAPPTPAAEPAGGRGRGRSHPSEGREKRSTAAPLAAPTDDDGNPAPKTPDRPPQRDGAHGRLRPRATTRQQGGSGGSSPRDRGREPSTREDYVTREGGGREAPVAPRGAPAARQPVAEFTSLRQKAQG